MQVSHATPLLRKLRGEEMKLQQNKVVNLRLAVERNSRMDQAAWGGYVRHNELFRRVFDESGALLGEEFLFSNDAIMMYSPLLPEE